MSSTPRRRRAKRAHRPTIPNHLPDPTPVYKRCVVKACPTHFWAPRDIIYCPGHRLTIEQNAHYRYPKPHERELLDRISREGDWQLYDEHHRLVWAKDLAKRYKREMRRAKDSDRSGAVLI